MREKRQQRELEILEQAQTLVEEVGFFDMKMSELAKRSKLSVGTLYSHYPCKEDLLIALAVRHAEEHVSMFRAFAEFGETPM